jgi:NCS1 family nucleobase:cation symporter-1
MTSLEQEVEALHLVGDKHGIEPIATEDRDSTPLEQFWIWMGANMAPINWILGALGIVLGLSVVQTLLVVAVGNLIGCAIMGLWAVMGFRTGVNAMTLSRAAFGRRGGYLPSVMQSLMALGWVGVNTWIVLDLAVGVFDQLGVGDSDLLRYGLALAIMLIQVGIAVYGYQAIRAFEKWTVPIALAVMAAMSVLAFTKADVHFSSGGGLSSSETIASMSQLMAAIGIGWGASWWTFAPDYSRFVKPSASERSVFWSTAVGMFVPTVWLAFLGAAIASSSESADPATLVTTAFGAMSLPVLLLILHGPIATNIVNIYSSSLGFLSLDVKPARWKATALVGLISTVVLIFFLGSNSFAQSFDNWMSSLVVFFCPLMAVMTVDFFVINRGRIDVAALYDDPSRSKYGDVSIPALVALLCGIAAGWSFEFGLVPALQGPFAKSLNDVDFSWLAGTLVAGIVYYGLAQLRLRSQAAAAVQAPPAPAPPA